MIRLESESSIESRSPAADESRAAFADDAFSVQLASTRAHSHHDRQQKPQACQPLFWWQTPEYERTHPQEYPWWEFTPNDYGRSGCPR